MCAWDGMTYIVDQQRNSVRFQFEQNVSAFAAGIYSTCTLHIKGGRKKGRERERERERERWERETIHNNNKCAHKPLYLYI